jgi:DNA-binding response OmpR family regulator
VKNILIVDNDLGFVFWLCQALDAAGYETLPAKGVPEAVALLDELEVWVDVLMVRRTLPGADVFAAELRGSQRGHVKTIALLDQNDEQSESMADWDGWQVKLKVSDTIARKIFLSLVHSALTNGTTVPTI